MIVLNNIKGQDEIKRQNDKPTSKCTLEELVSLFQEKGGKINNFYLHSSVRTKRTLVHLNGWHSGLNMREAIIKALGSES
jgi:hypothetical protein